MKFTYVVEINAIPLTLKFYFESYTKALECLETLLEAHSDTDDGVAVKFSIYEITP
jgi:hypothetical protein